MVDFNKFNQFVEDQAHKVHNLSSDTPKVALTNTIPLAADALLSDITEINYDNCSSRALTISSSGQTSGVYKLVIADLILTASGGSFGPFRYVVVYNNTPNSPLKPLIGWYDRGDSITVPSGQTLTLDFDGTNGLLQTT